MKYYAGIGSRETPTEICLLMTELAKKLSDLDYILRSGGAKGADLAFEKGLIIMLRQFPEAWIQTYSGIKFYPLEPDINDIKIEDISWSLSHQCRFTGHCSRFYSVAEHSLYVSQFCSQENKLWGLLHDATEAYLADIARPIKLFMPEYKIIEKLLGDSIATKFKLSLDMPEEVKTVDLRILGDEKDELMHKSPEPWTFIGERLGVDFVYSLAPIELFEVFMKEFTNLSKAS